jgi:transposase
MFLVTQSTRIKNRIHAILWKHGLSSPKTDLFGKKGRIWLEAQELRPIYKQECASLLRVFDGLFVETELLNKEILARAKQNEETKLLMTMPGIGPFSALIIQAEVGDFARFSNPEKLASYSGLISRSRSSGGRLQFGNITHAGSVYLRTAMVEAACQVRPKWETLYQFYEKIKEKKGNKTARVALARKMLCILWCMVKKKEPFRAISICGDSGGVKR